VKLKYSAKAHGYWLDGKRCKSPSAIAKVPDDSSALDKWRRRQTAIGLAMRPELLTEIAANVEDKQSVDAICERAMDHAGASSGRNWGSAVHLVIERDIAGATILDTPETARVRRQWQQLLDDHHLEVVRAEAVIVHPKLMIAGRFDQVMRSRINGEMFVMDVKTGASADQFLQSHAVQLWLYASASLMAAGPQGDVDFEVTEFTPMLDVSQSVAFVAHLPQEGEPSIIPVDIAAGGQCFHDVIRPTWAWRARKDLRAEMPAASKANARPDPHRNAKALSPAPSPSVAARPEEGSTVDVAALRERYVALDAASVSWVGEITTQALQAGLPIHLKDNLTARRARILDGLVTLAEGDADDDDAVRALCRHILDDDAVEWPTVPVGAVVGRLSATTAATFAAAAEMFVAGRYGLTFQLDGPTLSEVAA
jgi:hypothetical protein